MSTPAVPRTVFTDRPIRVAFLAGLCLLLSTACFTADGAFAPPPCVNADTLGQLPDTTLPPDTTRVPPLIEPEPDYELCRPPNG